MSWEAQASREKQARIILGQAEVETANLNVAPPSRIRAKEH
jgi:hypothetical protein